MEIRMEVLISFCTNTNSIVRVAFRRLVRAWNKKKMYIFPTGLAEKLTYRLALISFDLRTSPLKIFPCRPEMYLNLWGH